MGIKLNVPTHSHPLTPTYIDTHTPAYIHSHLHTNTRTSLHTLNIPTHIHTYSKFPLPAGDGPLPQLARRVSIERKSKTALVLLGHFSEDEESGKTAALDELLTSCNFGACVTVSLPLPVPGKNPGLSTGFMLDTMLTAEFAAKLVFNAITTGACVQKGRVFGNRMINLGIRYFLAYVCIDIHIDRHIDMHIDRRT